MDDEEYEADYDFEGYVSRPFRKEDIWVLGLNFVAGISRAFTRTLSAAEVLAAAHANYKIDREQFHEEAALELEMLISGEDDDA